MPKRNVGKIIAVSEAVKSTHKFRVGCAIMSGRRELSRGRNSYKTRPVTPHVAHQSNKTHAEASAILRTHKHDLDGSTLYVARVLRSGALAMARPCRRCVSIMLEKGIQDVLYSTEDGWEKIIVS